MLLLALFISLICFLTPYCVDYPCYEVRETISLDGLWKFTFKKRPIDPESLNPFTLNLTDQIIVPGVYDSEGPNAGLRGSGVYKRIFPMRQNTFGRIKFEGCGMWCKVFIDGEVVGIHNNSYSPFWIDIKKSDKSIREIVVIADNQFVKSRYPTGYYEMDFWQFGGISRSVTLYVVDDLSIINSQVIIHNDRLEVIDLRIRIKQLENKLPNKLTFNINIDENKDVTYESIINHNDYFIYNISITNPLLWSPESPNLHTFTIKLMSGNNVIDQYEDRFGLRSITTCYPYICVNGKPTKLKGYCRHEMHQNYGSYLPKIQMFQDIKLLKNIGGNYFRLVHYPHDPRFLSLCDELGVLVWLEQYGWGNDESYVNNPLFITNQLLSLDEIVNNTVNHPSIIIWSYLNEGCSQSLNCCDKIYNPLSSRYRELLVPGLISYASDKRKNDKCLNTTDIISFNSYPGWLDATWSLEDNLNYVATFLTDLISWTHSTYPNIPLLLSEIGAGAMYGWEDVQNGYWTEQYQMDYAKRVLDTTFYNNTIAGISFWQYHDTRTYNGVAALRRARAMSNSGSLDEYRRPKKNYYFVKQYFENDKV